MSNERHNTRLISNRRGLFDPLLLGELCQDGFVQANAGIHVLEREVLVRRVCAAIRQGETKQKRLNSKDGAELRDDRDAASLTNERRIFAKRFTQRALRSLPYWRMRIGQVPRSAVTP